MQQAPPMQPVPPLGPPPRQQGTPRENMLAHFHPSRLAFFKLYVSAIALIVITLLLQTELMPTIVQQYRLYTLVLIAPAVILLLLAELRRMTDTYTITNLTVVERIGILRINESFVNVDKISSTTIKQSLLDRLFDIGSIEMWSTGGSDEPEISIEKIANVRRTKQIIDQLVQQS